MHQDRTGEKVWRGDAEYYRARLRESHTPSGLVDITCHSYVTALAERPLMRMGNHASYLSSVLRIEEERVVEMMSERIAAWIASGDVVLPEELQIMIDRGEIEVPFVTNDFPSSFSGYAS